MCRLLQPDVPSVGSLEHLSWAFLLALVCCLKGFLVICKEGLMFLLPCMKTEFWSKS